MSKKKQKPEGKFYHMIDNLSIFIKTATIEAKQYVAEALDFYIAEYHRIRLGSNAESAAFNFHILVESAIQKKVDQVKETQPVSCRKGCSFCCRVHVDITEDEGTLLLSHVAEEKISFDMERVLRQAEYGMANWTQQDKADWGCVFLDHLNGTCKVYKHRPAACRAHYVASEAKLCDPQLVGAEVSRLWDVDAAILVSATMNASPVDGMAKVLKKLLINKSKSNEQSDNKQR